MQVPRASTDTSVWYIDSGSSRHMTGSKDLLINYRATNGPQVIFGDNSKGKTKGIGIMHRGNIMISDVYYVEGLKHNLLSISQFCDKGFEVKFSSDFCYVNDAKTKSTKLRGKRTNNVYLVDWDSTFDNNPTCFVAKNQNELGWLWHRKMNHLNFKAISQLISLNLVEGLPKGSFQKNRLCDACQMGKQVKSSFKKKTHLSTSRVLELLHLDLFGPIQIMSVSGKKYSLVIVDDFSRYTWVEFLATKDETSGKLTALIRQLQTSKDVKVTRIRSDRGTEFTNQFVEKFCTEFGILHEYSAPRTPQQNGVAERRNRTLKEAARTMLAESKLPQRFWAEAINTACYTQNRCMINKQHEKTPYELWKGRKPNVSYFHVFGSKCFIHNNGSHSLRTFDPKADEGTFLGYAKNGKSFRILNKIKSKVEESIHVVFDDANQEPSKVNSNDEGIEDLSQQASQINLGDDSDDESDEIFVTNPKITREVINDDIVRIADDHEENDHQEQIGTVNEVATAQETNEDQAIDNQESLNPFQPNRK